MKHDFSKTLFRASGNWQLMTNPRKGSPDPISETTKKYLVGVMISECYGRRKELMNKFIQKGLMVEEDAITLVSRARQIFYKKNDVHLENDFIKGTPDIFEGEEIARATKIIDIKSSFDIFTFFNSKYDDLADAYYWQIQSYLDLTGATQGEIIHCLVNTPESIIEGQKRKFMWDAGIKGDDELNHEAFAEIERLSIYDDIPIEERYSVKVVERNQEEINRLHERVLLCREWMNENFNK